TARSSPKPAVAAMHAATATRGPIDAARTGPTGARNAMHRTGIDDSSPATAWFMPRSAWMSLSSGPTARIGTRKTRAAMNSAATTDRSEPDVSAGRSLGVAAGVASSATQASADPRRRGPHRRRDPVGVAVFREAVRRAVDMDRRDHLRARIGDRRRHGAQALGVFVANPGVAVAADLTKTLQQRRGIRERLRGERLERLGEVAREHGSGHLRQEDLAGRDGVERDPRACPV